MRLQIVNERTVDVFDPELLRQVMVDHADALIRWERGTEVFAEGLGQSVPVTEGAVWQRQRRMLMQAFTPRRLAGYVAQMVEATTQGLTPQRSGEQAMDSLFSHLAMDVISRTMFGEDSDTALSAPEVFDQCLLSFQAGHETTATALLWWSWLMACHPQAQARAAAEIDACLAGQAPGADAMQALPWLSATLKEAMRLFPPVAALMTRRLPRDIELAGVRLPARTLVRVTPWLLHRDPRWWPREPDAFRPERFMAATDDWQPDPIPRGAYIPFGLGPRVCLGQHFAQLEMTVIAALLLQRFRLSTLSDTAPTPLLAVTLRPAGGVRLMLAARP